MADKTGIEWTDATVNFWWGCTKVGPGCDHCYAETHSNRFTPGHWGNGAPRRKIKGAAALLAKLDNDYSWWATDAAIGGYHPNITRRVFIQSMSDLFDLEVPLDWFGEAWAEIGCRKRINIQIVTKRISAVEKRLTALADLAAAPGHPGFGKYGLKPPAIWPNHAGLMLTICNQAEAERDIPRLLALKAKLGIPWIGLSIEPLLGQITIPAEWLMQIDWIVVGGESGPGARPMHPDWARSIRDQCTAAGTAFLFKQWGEWMPVSSVVESEAAGIHAKEHLILPENSDDLSTARDKGIRRALLGHDCVSFARVGKKRAGRLLDGVTHDGYPGGLTNA